jgi:YD repeat-containing protein
MTDSRLALAAIAIAAAATAGAAQAASAGAPATETRYQCDAAQHLVVRRTADKASVEFIDRTYTLQRKASGIGEQYLAPKAALIIDGPEAVFVADDRLQLGRCVESSTATVASL